MPENKPISLVNGAVSEDTALSESMAIVSTANDWTNKILSEWASKRQGIFIDSLEDTRKKIARMLGMEEEARPADFSQEISLRKQFREQEASQWSKL